LCFLTELDVFSWILTIIGRFLLFFG